MTAHDVEQSIIRRLHLSQPPNYLKGNAAAIEEELALYRRSLARFDRSVLEGAWLEAASRNAYRCWPSCAAILTAAERLHEIANPPPKPGPPDDWVEKATAMADEAVRKFMKSAQATRAKAGGYEAEMRGYAREAAWVQAQMILSRPYIAHRSPVLFAHCPDDREEQEAFFARCREQAATGAIKVVIPPQTLKAWRQEHAQERGR